MSLCVTDKRKTIINGSIMENFGLLGHLKNNFIKVDEVRKTEDAEADPTPPTAMEETTAAQSADNEMELNNRLDNIRKEKDRTRLSMKNLRKTKSGSRSGDKEIGQPEDSAEVAAKKRKTRRGKPKHRKSKPYSEQQLLRCQSNGRIMKKSRRPKAPYNTTQFLMEDHRTNLPSLDETVRHVVNDKSFFQKPSAPSRTRDSSFSIDSDEEYFYSSPEDEEEFLTKEFSSAYEDYHAERLSALSKSDLIQEYIQLETRFDVLTKRLRFKSGQQPDDVQFNEMDEKSRASGTLYADLTKKLKIYQQRIDDLIQQNDQLRRDNEALRCKGRSSVDSESDSDSCNSCNSSNGNRTCCSCSEAGATPPIHRCSRHNVDQKISSRVSTEGSSDNEYVDGSVTHHDSSQYSS